MNKKFSKRCPIFYLKDDNIYSLFYTIYTIKDIAYLCGCSESTVYNAKKYYGLDDNWGKTYLKKHGKCKIKLYETPGAKRAQFRLTAAYNYCQRYLNSVGSNGRYVGLCKQVMKTLKPQINRKFAELDILK